MSIWRHVKLCLSSFETPQTGTTKTIVEAEADVMAEAVATMVGEGRRYDGGGRDRGGGDRGEVVAMVVAAATNAEEVVVVGDMKDARLPARTR